MITLLILYINLGFKVGTWYFNDAQEGEVGSFTESMLDGFIEGLVIETSPPYQSIKKMMILTEGGLVLDLKYSFPSNWLFEDFEQKLIDGIKKYQDSLVEENRLAKEKRDTEFAKTKKLVQEAKSKLSPEELKALKKLL